MRLKSELYPKEQEEIVDKIITILDLDEENSTTLYEIDHNEEKKKKLNDLMPEIRKFFSFSYIAPLQAPEKYKRPYLSMIRNLTKIKYNMYNCDIRITIERKRTRTVKYVFVKK